MTTDAERDVGAARPRDAPRRAARRGRPPPARTSSARPRLLLGARVADDEQDAHQRRRARARCRAELPARPRPPSESSAGAGPYSASDGRRCRRASRRPRAATARSGTGSCRLDAVTRARRGRARAPTPAISTRSRRSQPSERPVPARPLIAGSVPRRRRRRRSGAGTAPRASAGGSSSVRHAEPVSCRSASSRRLVSTSKRARVPSTCRSWTPGSASSPSAAARSRRRSGARQVAQVGERAGLDRAPGADDRHAVARAPRPRRGCGSTAAPCGPRRGARRDARAEDLLHQRVEPGRRLVEDQQLDVGRQRGDERDLLAVALGVRAALLGRVELEALEQVGAAPRIETRRAAGRAGRSPRRRSGWATAFTSPGTYASRRCSATASRHGSPPSSARAPASARSSPSSTRIVVDLPAAVGTEEAVDLARGDLEVEAVERAGGAERLDEPGDLDRGGHARQRTETSQKRETSEVCV